MPIRRILMPNLWAILFCLIMGTGCFRQAVDTQSPVDQSLSKSQNGKALAHQTGADETLWQRWKSKLPWNRKKDQGISDETVDLVRAYLQENQLVDIHVEYRNRIAKEEWQRLKDNEKVRPVARYTVGSVHWLASSLHLPFFSRRNHYDLFSDTLYLNSDNPPSILAELALAKELRRSHLPGAKAVLVKAPVISIYARASIAREVCLFAQKHNDWPLEKQTYRELYPGMLTGASVLTAPFTPFYVMPLIKLGGMAVGTALGEATIQMRENEIRQAKAQGRTPEFPQDKPPGDGLSVAGEVAKVP